MENKQYQPRWEVDFSNPNANNITTGTTTGKPIENKQTAVEWLMNELTKNGSGAVRTFGDLFQQALEMEKKQMINLIKFMRTQDKMGKSVEDLFEQYHNETYGNKTTDI